MLLGPRTFYATRSWLSLGTAGAQRAFSLSSAVLQAAKTQADTPKAESKVKADKAPKEYKSKAPSKPQASPTRLTAHQRALLPPKKPMSPYMRFYREMLEAERAKLAGEVFHLPRIQLLASAAGQAWKNLTLGEKAKYAVPESEMADYAKRMKEWEQSISREDLDAINKKRKASGLNKIKVPEHAKKPAGAYALFLKDFHSKHIATDVAAEELTPTNLMKKAAETYKSLSPEEKQPFIDAARESREQWHANNKLKGE